MSALVPSMSVLSRSKKAAPARAMRQGYEAAGPLGAVDLDDDRVALAAAGADRRHAEPAAAPAQLVHERARMRAPLAPIGWPSAIAPPLTLTLSSSTPSIRIEFSATDANASLISNRSMSSTVEAGLVERELRRVRRACGRGTAKSSATAAWATIVASTSRPLAFAHSSEESTSAPAPSLTPGVLPAVWVPSLTKTPLELRELLERRVAARRLVDLDHVLALLASLTVTGTISSGRRPSSVAWIAQVVAAQREGVHVGAGHLELRGDLVGLLRHVLAGERVRQAVVDHRVEQLAVAHAEAEAGLPGSR